MAKKLCAQWNLPGLMVDIRGHGKSRRITAPPSSLATCATELGATLEANGVSSDSVTLVGHSLGGRISIEYAATVAAPRQVWLLDTVPGEAHRSVTHVMEIAALVLQREQPYATTRDLAQDLQSSHGLDTMTAQWLASNYKNHDFNFDLAVAQALAADIGNQDLCQRIEAALQQGVLVDLVRGGKNPAWKQHLPRLQAMEDHQSFQIHALEQAGHWVHVDDLNGLLKVMSR